MSSLSLRSNLTDALARSPLSSSGPGTHVHYHLYRPEIHLVQPDRSKTNSASDGIVRIREITSYVLLVLGVLTTLISMAAIGTQFVGVSFVFLPPSLGNLFFPGLSALLTGLQFPGQEAKSVSDFHKFFSLMKNFVYDVL